MINCLLTNVFIKKINALGFVLFILIVSYTSAAFAQDEPDVNSDWSGYKVYTSMAMALQNPDSVFILNLSKKKLSELPQEIKQLKNLQKLDISKNKLKELPAFIGSLAGLIELDASANNLEKIPAEIGYLKNLKRLNLNRNVIDSLPVEIGQLSNLEYLEMWDNELEYVPDAIKNLRNLKVLELRGILFEKEEQNNIQNLLPDTKIYFSPPCNCAMKW